jgi:Ca-activated chloride channel family protein
MEQVRTNGEQKELRDEIVDLGTRYGIVTPYTSYLALEDARMLTYSGGAQPGTATRRAAGAPLGALNAPAAQPPKPAIVVTGEQAINLSKMAREQQDASRLKDDARSDAVRRVAGKTFYLVDGVWTDSEFKTESRLPETAITFGSDEYFALLKQNPKLGSYFSLGERVVVVFEGRVYRVNAT